MGSRAVIAFPNHRENARAADPYLQMSEPAKVPAVRAADHDSWGAAAPSRYAIASMQGRSLVAR